MDKIKKIFLTKTIPDLLNEEFDMPYIKFVFDEKTLDELWNDLYEEFQNDCQSGRVVDSQIYRDGLKSLLCLQKNRLIYRHINGDDVFIPVHDSKQFFSLLQELIDLYAKRRHSALLDDRNFIRSIWLRMGVEDVENVEIFLRRQRVFVANESVISEREEFAESNDDRLVYSVNENRDWFETNKNIVFSIHRLPLKGQHSFKELLELRELPSNEYEFPAIHFAFSYENNRPICYLYGIQQIDHPLKGENIKKIIQPIRKQLRNKYASADILIGLSLFFDFLYGMGIEDVIIPTLQVFNYPFHEHLYSSFKYDETALSGEKKELVPDDISWNKSERLAYSIMELCERYPVLHITSYPFEEGENLHVKINGEINLLNSFTKVLK